MGWNQLEQLSTWLVQFIWRTLSAVEREEVMIIVEQAAFSQNMLHMFVFCCDGRHVQLLVAVNIAGVRSGLLPSVVWWFMLVAVGLGKADCTCLASSFLPCGKLFFWLGRTPYVGAFACVLSLPLRRNAGLYFLLRLTAHALPKQTILWFIWSTCRTTSSKVRMHDYRPILMRFEQIRFNLNDQKWNSNLWSKNLFAVQILLFSL